MRYYLLCFCAIFLSSCAIFDPETKAKIPGNRISVFDHSASDVSPQVTNSITTSKPTANHLVATSDLNDVNHLPQNIHFGTELTTVRFNQSFSFSNLSHFIRPLIVDGKLYSLNRDSVQSYDLISHKILWNVKLESALDSANGGGLATDGRRIYVTNASKTILCLDSKSGEILWSKTMENYSNSPALVYQNFVYVLSADNKLYAFDASNGDLKWQYEGPDVFFKRLSSISLTLTGDFVMVPYNDGVIHILERTRGGLLATMNLNQSNPDLVSINDFAFTPIFDEENHRIYAASLNGKFAAMDLMSGKTLWERTTEYTSGAWVMGNRIFLISGNKVISYDNLTSNIAWSKDLPQDKKYKRKFFGPLVIDSKLTIFDSTGRFYEFDINNGSEIKSGSLGKAIVQTPIIIGDNLIIISSNDTIYIGKGK